MTPSLLSSPPRALHGRQAPSVLTLPDRADSKLEELLDLLFVVGVKVDLPRRPSLCQHR
jgi:hypothetical protein